MYWLYMGIKRGNWMILGMKRRDRWKIAIFGVCALFLFGGCEGLDVQPDPGAPDREKRETVFGDGGISFLGEKKRREDSGGGGIGVNSYLWRATLDTITFMPINSADPFGGVIITDWHSPIETPDERFKMNIYILGRTLRADGIRVTVFKQSRNANIQWQDAAVGGNVATDIENAILTRARQLRNETTGQEVRLQNLYILSHSIMCPLGAELKF